MRWDLGLQGLGLLIVMSLGFGMIAQLVVGRATTRWLWLIAAAGYFIGGLFVSEVWFGWATQEELQPNIDGLSFDEVLLLGLVPGIVTVLVTRYVTRKNRRHSTDTALKRSGTSRLGRHEGVLAASDPQRLHKPGNLPRRTRQHRRGLTVDDQSDVATGRRSGRAMAHGRWSDWSAAAVA